MNIQNTNKIILALTVIVIILILVGIIVARRPKTPVPVSQPTPTPIAIAPTEIITPTTAFRSNELDLVSISPQDKAVNISTSTALKIKFSRSIQTDEIKLYMDPPAQRNEQIEGNTLIAKPVTSWESGTVYRFSIFFVNAKEKNRTYTFTTAGPTSKTQIPGDTGDEEAMQEERTLEREQNPDIYVANNAPYDSVSFFVDSEYVRTPPHMGIRVTLKGDNKEQSKQDVLAWLKTIGLRDDQILNLDIQYK